MTRVLTALQTGMPGSLFPDPENAREWLREELARPEYQEPFLERVARWFNELVESVRDATASGGGLSRLAALVLLALLLVGVAVGALAAAGQPHPAVVGHRRLLGGAPRPRRSIAAARTPHSSSNGGTKR